MDKETKIIKCDDSMSTQSELILELNTREIPGIYLHPEAQYRLPLFLQKQEIAELISALQYFHDKIPD